MELPKDPLGLMAAGIASGVGALIWLRTKLSRDSAAIAGARAEVDMIERLTAECKALREQLEAVSSERNQLYRDLGEMTGAMRALEANQKMMELQVVGLKEEIVSLHQALEESNRGRTA